MKSGGAGIWYEDSLRFGLVGAEGRPGEDKVRLYVVGYGKPTDRAGRHQVGGSEKYAVLLVRKSAVLPELRGRPADL